MQITISYRTSLDVGWTIRPLLPEEYFDPDEKRYSIDSMPRFDHAIDYLPYDSHAIAQTRLEVVDHVLDRSVTIIETFWNEGQCRLVERSDGGTEPYWELIQELRLSDRCHQILRIGRAEGALVVYSHVQIARLDDGSYVERRLYPPDPLGGRELP